MKSIYIINETGTNNYKIGRTLHGAPEDRLDSLRTGNSNKLELIGYIELENPKVWEKELHFTFRSKRKRGEWFTLSHSDLKLIHDITEVDSVDPEWGFLWCVAQTPYSSPWLSWEDLLELEALPEGEYDKAVFRRIADVRQNRDIRSVNVSSIE